MRASQSLLWRAPASLEAFSVKIEPAPVFWRAPNRAHGDTTNHKVRGSGASTVPYCTHKQKLRSCHAAGQIQAPKIQISLQRNVMAEIPDKIQVKILTDWHGWSWPV